MKLSQLAALLGGRLVGDGDIEIERPVHPARVAEPGDLPLILGAGAIEALEPGCARAALVVEGIDVPDGLVSGYVVIGTSRYVLADLFDAFPPSLYAPVGIHPSAVVEDEAEIGAEVSVGPFVYVGPRAKIGRGTVLMPHVTVGAEASIGEDCRLHSGVRIGERVVLGNRNVLQHNACVGPDGFSYATADVPGSREFLRAGRVEPFLHDVRRINPLGTVITGDDVDVGGCSVIDRATIGATTVGRGTRIGSLTIIAHNCRVGENCLFIGCVGIAGSVTFGDRVILAGQAGVVDHVEIGSDTIVGAQALVHNNVPPNSMVLGSPALPAGEYLSRMRNTGAGRIKRMGEQIKDLAARVKRLEGPESETDR